VRQNFQERLQAMGIVLVKRREEIVEVRGAMVRRIATVYERYPDRGR